ncbi:MAG TPA: hypothetical protein VGO22_23490 [Pseudorhizobium sp.]|nr:hypothetical protein [Pseudorhizobium sp.]
MTEVTSERMYELLKKMQSDIASLKFDVTSTKTELSSLLGSVAA